MMAALHPEVVKKAQEELDRVTGGERLPTFDDRVELPYIDCIMKEVFRYVELWLLLVLTNVNVAIPGSINPVAPLGTFRLF